MLFNSYLFVFLFLPLAFAGFQLACRFGRVPASIWLVAASFLFYGWWNPPSVCLLAASIAFNYAAAELAAAMSARPRARVCVLVTAIGANVAALVYYKYLASLITLLAGLGAVQMRPPSIVLPLGISFFTFTQIGYLVDRSQGVARDRGLLDYVLFVTFFPHLIAGPILHNGEIMPQFADRRTYRFSRENVSVGLTIFVLGLAKKCLFADPLATVVTGGFADAPHLSALAAWNVALCASLQIYFDFSGYSDMAIGLARIFNVRFPLNFNSPYKAASTIEHWQRWHMTLSRYLALYLYNPIALAITRRRAARGLGINRAAQATWRGFAAMIAVPTLVTMMLAGIWHGAGLQYVIFGALHGSYLTINHAWRVFAGPERWTARPGRGRHAASVGLTYLASVVAMIFFRAPSTGAAWQVVTDAVGWNGLGRIDWPGGLPLTGFARSAFVPVGATAFLDAASQVALVFALLAIAWFAPNTQQIMGDFEPALGRFSAGPAWLRWQPRAGWGIATGIVASLGVLAVGGTTEFLYFQF